MKKRVGFVSNSSTCSFVVIGARFKDGEFVIPEDVKIALLQEKGIEFDKEDSADIDDSFQNLLWYDSPFDVEIISTESGTTYVGEQIVRIASDDGYVDEVEFDFENTGEIKQKIRDLLVKLGFEDNFKVALYVDTDLC